MTDNLHLYETFRNLPEDAQQRVRAEVAKKLRPTTTNNIDLARRVAAATDHVIKARPFDEPIYADISQVQAFENVDRKAESIVSQWYNTTAGRKFRALHFLYGADDTIRFIAEKALKSYPTGINAGFDELIAFSPARPGDYWKITNLDDLHMVMELLSLDIHCDLDLFKNTEPDSCMKTNTKFFDGLKRLDQGGCVGKDGLPNPHQREFIPNYFGTVPFARGNILVLSRICMTCYGAWIYRNHIDTNKIGEIEPLNDGFGRVGGGPIIKSEYLWNQNVVEQVAREWELRKGKPPTLIKLQNALQHVAFVGAESDQAHKGKKKRNTK